jgi:phosphoribosylformylglycinamidine cyclo-ligase
MSTPLTYKNAGVDIELGNELVDNYKDIVSSTFNPAVLNPLGGFCSLYDLSHYNLKQPVLVSSTDGVGTKLRLALQWNNHKGVGIDLVAMCVNDLLVTGAKPLFFLDYYASGKLDKKITLEVVQSIATGCKIAGMALVGGETAEMPGMYHNKDYDLAGFCVGAVEKSEIVNGSDITVGDTLIAIASSGVHSNGYSLVRKILESKPALEDDNLDGRSIKDILLTPTKIYSQCMQALHQAKLLKGAAHITGGGITENVPRFIPKSFAAKINTNSWHLPPVFDWIQTHAQLSVDDLRITYNCGVGMVVCVAKENAQQALALLAEHHEDAWIIGEMVENTQGAQVIYTHE